MEPLTRRVKMSGLFGMSQRIHDQAQAAKWQSGLHRMAHVCTMTVTNIVMVSRGVRSVDRIWDDSVHLDGLPSGGW